MMNTISKKHNVPCQKKPCKVLLVYPEIPPTYWSFRYALSFVKKKASIPPLGLLTVAALLPPHYEARLVDMNITTLPDEEITGADLILTSAMIVQKNSLADLAQRCNKLHVPIVAGGPYPTSSYDKIPYIDHFVINEAELTLPLFLKDWGNGAARRVYTHTEKPDITKSPTPRFDLLELSSYGSMALQYSRGCPFNCEFCDIIEMFGRRPRTKTSQQVIRELDALYTLGWRGSVFFVDDNFIGNQREVKGLLSSLSDWQKERHYPFELFTEASINLAADEELLNLMSAAGFNMVFVGIETPVKETLLNTGKIQNTNQDMMEGIKKIQNKGIEVTGGFIVGFDTDPDDIFERQIQFIQEAGIPLAMVGLLSALPNTQLFRRLQEEGRLLQETSGNNTHDLELNFSPKMDLHTLLEGYKHIIATIYSPKEYFERCLIFLKALRPHQNSSRKIRQEEAMAFFRSLFRQSFTSYGHYYLSFLLKAFAAEPRMFPEAVRQAIMGHHFFKITKEILAVDDFKIRARSIKEVYLEKVREGYSSLDLEKRIEELKIARDRFISELQKEYRKIDKDFRHLVEDSLRNVEAALNAYYAQCLNTCANI